MTHISYKVRIFDLFANIYLEKIMNNTKVLYEFDDLAKLGMYRFINEVSLERFVAFKRQQTDILMGI